MKRTLLTAAAVLAILPAAYGLNAAITAGEATAETVPTVTRSYGYNGDGKRVVCMASSAGGIDCDFDRPTRLQPRAPRQ